MSSTKQTGGVPSIEFKPKHKGPTDSKNMTGGQDPTRINIGWHEQRPQPNPNGLDGDGNQSALANMVNQPHTTRNVAQNQFSFEAADR